MSDDTRYAILIGNSEFLLQSGLNNLRCPKNDVEGMYELITCVETGLFPTATVSKLINLPHYEINRHINIVSKRANPNDVIFIYYSGHGKQDIAGHLYLAAADTCVDTLETSSISLAVLKNILDLCSSRRIIIILDCCFGGAAGTAFVRGSADDQLKMFSRAQGTYLLTASTRIQTAQEKEGDKNAVFTKHLIAGIKSGEADTDGNGKVTMDEVFSYVYKHVTLEAPQEPERYFLGARGELVFAKTPIASQRPGPLSELATQTDDPAGPLLLEHVPLGSLSKSACLCVAVSRLGRFCGVGYEDGTVGIVHLLTRNISFQQREGSRGIWDIAFSPAGNQLAWVNANSEVVLYELEKQKFSYHKIDRGRLTNIVFCNEQMAACCTREGSIILMDVTTGVTDIHDLLSSSIRTFAYYQRDNLLSISGKRNRLSLFDINSRAFIFDMETEWACPSAMTFMADKVLACGFTTGEMQVVDLESRSGREKEQHSDWAISGISFNTRSQLLLGIDETPVLRALDPKSLRIVSQTQLPSPVTCMTCDETTSMIVTGCRDGNIYLVRQFAGLRQPKHIELV